jgi:CHAT domain-containing protein
LSQKIVHQKEATLRLPLDASLNNIQLTGTRLLGDVFRQLGYLQKSQDLLEKVERVITQEKYPQAKALVLLSLGNTYQAFGNRNRFLADSQENNQKDYYQLATDSYRKAVEEAADASLVKVQAQLNLLSLLVDSKRGVGVNFKEAKELRLQILSQLSQLSKLLPTRQIIYAENSLVKSLVSLKNAELKTASNLANSNAEKTEKLSNYCLLNSSIVPESVAESVSVNTEAVSWREIVELGAKAVKLARELGDLRATAYALGTLGGVYEENQQWFEAQKCTEKALLLSQNVQLNSPDLAYQWQWQLGRIRRNREEKDIQGAIAAYTAAFNTLQSVRNDLVPISRDGQFDFRDRIEPVYRELVDLLLQGEEPSPDNLKQARNVIEALQVAELDNFFRDACVPIKTKQIDGIDRTAAVIYPIILEDRLEVIVSLPNQLLHHRSSDAPRKKVEDFVKKLQDELSEAGERAEVPKLSKNFYEWLIEPFNKSLKQYPDLKTLVFVLDGSLRNIPMGVLYDYDEVTQKGNYLIENYAIAVAPGLQLISPNFWQAERLKVLIAGLSEERQFPGRTPFPALKYVEQELGNIQKEVPSSEKPLINQDFLKTSLKNQINSLRSSVVHIATHGEFSSDPEQTFIVAYDDVIQSKELSDILSGRRASEGNSIELLVLSGCKTAKGDPRAALGLAGVAVRSGARSTLATLWYVDDESTAELMVQFYNELKKPNVSKAEALRQAQLSLLAKQPDSYYWAPFVMLGNWL